LPVALSPDCLVLLRFHLFIVSKVNVLTLKRILTRYSAALEHDSYYGKSNIT
jgi:hypothetical protein